MEETVWHLKHGFETIPARDVLKTIIEDDKRNLDKAESELKENIGLLDDAIVLYIEALQGAYRMKDNWEKNDSNRVAIAMLVSTLNYILLSRYGILIGYYPEVQDLLRSCYERTSRSYLFSQNDKFARKFLSGKKIKQCDVDEELSKLERNPEKRGVLYKGLREYYGFKSEVTHPNLKSFAARYGENNLEKTIGLQCVLGGIISTELGNLEILHLLQTVLSALKILGIILPEGSGRWEKEYERIRIKFNEMVEKLKNR